MNSGYREKPIMFLVIMTTMLAVTLLLISSLNTQAASAEPDSSSACWEEIENGDFETTDDWELPLTEYSAAYSKDQALSGEWSVRTGIIDQADNKYSYSSVSQVVTVPPSVTDATLRFSLFTVSDEPANLSFPDAPLDIDKQDADDAGDVQLVLILNETGDVELERLLMIREDDQAWVPYSFDLSDYEGETIRIYFGVYNNGTSGITGMYVDDVSLGNCQDPPLQDDLIFIPITMHSWATCEDLIINGGFEDSTGWEIPDTAYPAEYSTDKANNGAQSMRTGITYYYHNRFSYSSTNQQITIPAGATKADLEFMMYPISSEPYHLNTPPNPLLMAANSISQWGDVQLVLILDENGQEIKRLYADRKYDQTWLPYSFDLLEFAGQTVHLYFGTLNNGIAGVTAMFVDDVTLEICN